MNATEELKEIVRQKYGQIAESDQTQGVPVGGCGCGPTSCCGVADTGLDSILMAEDYSTLAGYAAAADYGLGCGLPTKFAKIKPGDVVVDLGSGAGNDCFVARAETGETGRVIGVDMTEKMVARARENAQKLGYMNVEFVVGDIEAMPLSNDTADVVVSNCVMNLVPDKRKAFAETYRILKPGGHFSISDIVLKGELPEGLQHDAELYAGCVSGAVQQQEYLAIIKEAGFSNITLQKERAIELPDAILNIYLSAEEKAAYVHGERGIYSITVYAEK